MGNLPKKSQIFLNISPLKGVSAVLIILALILPVYFTMAEVKNDSTPYPADLYAQCFDGVDNDGDGFIDLKDIDCPKCSDGIDNDGDGFIDEADPDCPKQKKSVLNAAAAALLFGNKQTNATSDTKEMRIIYIDSKLLPSAKILPVSNIATCRRIIVFRKIIPDPVHGFRFDYEFFCDNTIPIKYLNEDDVRRIGTRTIKVSTVINTVTLPLAKVINATRVINTVTLPPARVINMTRVITPTTLPVTKTLPAGKILPSARTI